MSEQPRAKPEGAVRPQVRRAAALALLMLLAFGVFSGWYTSERNGRRLDVALSQIEQANRDRAKLLVLVNQQNNEITALQNQVRQLGGTPTPGPTVTIPPGSTVRKNPDGTITIIPPPSATPRPTPRPAPAPSPTRSSAPPGGGGRPTISPSPSPSPSPVRGPVTGLLCDVLGICIVL